MRRHHAVASRSNVKFVPFSLEVYGNWGPAATDFFEHASAHIRNYRDVNFFQWSEASFRRYWSTALAAIVARGQGDANILPTCTQRSNFRQPSLGARRFALGRPGLEIG